jgi:hypothetical protein
MAAVTVRATTCAIDHATKREHPSLPIGTCIAQRPGMSSLLRLVLVGVFATLVSLAVAGCGDNGTNLPDMSVPIDMTVKHD